MLCLLFVGDLLGIKVERAWEFNSTFPLRSIIPIYLSTALPLLLLKALLFSCGYAISWYSLTVAVRLLVTTMSLITDYTSMQLVGWHRGGDAVSAAVVMATSYISLVYYTRTFSNTIESFLFAILLCLVRRSDRNSHFRHAGIISMLLVVGVFNRPTLLFYAAVPYLWWLFNDGLHRVIVKAVNSMLTAVPVSLTLVICDSIYFGYLDINNVNIANLGDFRSFLTHNLTLTPLNFILYNTRSGNLAEHGIHPRFTHFVVNVPLLFNVLSVYFFYDVFRWSLMVIYFRCHKLVSVYREKVILVICCLIPLSLLSVFPHQEPRFLIPLLPVFAALYACKITASGAMLAFWAIANVLGCLFFGCIHQAGVVPCLGYLQKTQSTGVERHVIFWHTYTAPQHLLLQPSEMQDQVHAGSTSVTSLEGISADDLVHHLTLLNSSHLEKPEVMIAAPSSEHYYLVCKAAEAGITLGLYQSFWPHLSTEHPPKLDDILCHFPVSSCHGNTDAAATVGDDDDDFCKKTLIDRIRFMSSLNLYQVTFS